MDSTTVIFPLVDPVGPGAAPLSTSHVEVVARAVAPLAATADAGGVQRSTLDALASAGLLGSPLPLPEQRELAELIAGSDATTWFCWVQHQTPLRTLYDELQQAGMTAHLVGGAYEAAELDAKRAIDQASRLAAEV